MFRTTNLPVLALLASIAAISSAITTKNSQALATSILALATTFLPALQLVFPWFQPPPQAKQ